MTSLISLVIPVRDGGHYLAEGLETALRQTYRPIEIIVVDDGSTDDTSKIAKSFQDVSYYFQEGAGVASARNTGVEKAEGEFIAFQDADDLAHSNRIELQYAYLSNNPDTDIVFCHIKNFLEKGVPKPSWLPSVHLEEPVSCFGSCALMTKKTVFTQVGVFNENYEVAEDVEWLMRAKDLGFNASILKEALIERRIHTKNLSYQRDKIRFNMLELFKASADRKLKKRKSLYFQTSCLAKKSY